jgi:oxygen-independent coproporphyrinogen-3 oxidase
LGQERTKPEDANRFEIALRQECLQSRHLLDSSLDTIFFGGGTPSMTPCDSMERALEPLWESTQVHSNTEWTMEANPSSIFPDSFRAYRKLGVNRISMGVQAMRPDLLHMLGRVHSVEAVIQALETVFDAGFENVSVDLLCGVPNQTEKDIVSALESLTQFPIQHLSCYLLTLPPHHKMYRLLPNEDQQLQHLLLVHDWMTAAGFEHYEISNFAKPNRRAQHNLNYWQGKSYLGLGPSAHSFDATQSERWKNVSSIHKYSTLLESNQSVMEWNEKLSPEQKYLEKWMLALRLNEGFPRDWLLSSLQKNRVEVFLREGLLEVHPHNSQRIRLTARGFALSDQVIRSLA